MPRTTTTNLPQPRTTCTAEATRPAVVAADLIEINEANDRGLIPRRRGRKRCRTELWAMRTRGTVNSRGERVVLQTILEKRTVYTTKEWIDAYFSALASTSAPPSARERGRRSYANTHATPQLSREAAATLRKHGLAAAAGLEPQIRTEPNT
jgi:hypothetical protein